MTNPIESTDPARPAALPAQAPACLNCGCPFAAERPRYCPDCGQRSTIRPPTLGEFVRQFGGAHLATEGALWRTLKLLLLRPGELTRQYLAGRRRHYVLPLRLYLTISVVVLLALRVVAGVGMAAPDAVQIDAAEATNFDIDVGVGRFGVADGVFICERLPGWACRRLERRIAADPVLLAREFRQAGERFVGNLGAAMFVLLPTFALWLKLVYPNRGLRYTEHLVFALHLHAFWFVALGATLFAPGWSTVLVGIAVPVYSVLALARVYGGRRWPRLLRALLLSVLYVATLLPTMAALAVVALLA